MAQKVSKVFIGLDNIASLIRDFREGFHRLGIETLTAIRQDKTIAESSSIDFVLEDMVEQAARSSGEDRSLIYKAANRQIWDKAIAECDTFLFIWYSFENDFSDLKTLKEAGKNIVVYFVGDDVRWKPAMEQEFARHGMPPIQYDPGYYRFGDLPVEQLHFTRMAERYADVIYNNPSQAQLALRPYRVTRIPLDLALFQENNRQRARPLLIHAPSSSALKGTRYVLPVVEQLKQDGIPFDFELIEGLPYTEALARYTDADLLVSQLFIPLGGRQEREALACGTVVLSSMHYDYHSLPFLDGCPVIDVRPDTLYDELKAILLDHDRRQKLAPLGRPYVAEHHDPAEICTQMVDLLQGDSEAPAHDIVPTFFRQQFVPEHPRTLSFYNRYTAFVKPCPWYEAHVPPGERDGLIF